MAAEAGSKPMKGMARVAFLAHLDAIWAELAQGFPLKAVYQKHQAKLGMSYTQFTRYCARLPRAEATLAPATAVRPKQPPTPAIPRLGPQPVAASPPPAPQIRGPANAGHQSVQPARTFNHDPLEKPGDRERLLGPDWKP